MKQTLLELTQDVLNAIDGDEVNSISDSTESLQIANDIKNVYYDLIGRKDWQFLRKLKELISVSDSDRPTHLLIPENTSKLTVLKYNKLTEVGGRLRYQDVQYKFPDEFLFETNQRDNTQSNYDVVVDFDGARIVIRNDIQPSFYTSFDDKYIVMDAYDSSIESTLVGDNTQALLFIHPTWTVDDDFIPELPDELFPLLLAECKTYANARIEDALMQKTEQTSKRHQRHLSQTHGVTQVGIRHPNYGRSSSKSSGGRSRSPLFGPRS